MFDIKTLAFVQGILSFMLTASMIYVFVSGKTYSGFKSWTLSFFISSIGLILIGLRGYIPDFLSIVIANLGISGSLILIDLGLSQFIKRVNPFWISVYLLTIVLQVIIFSYLTYIYPNIPYRIITINLLLTITLLHSIYQTILYISPLLKQNQWLLISTFSFLVIWFIIRTVLTFFEATEITSFMNAGFIHAIAFLTLIVGYTLIALGLIFLNSQRIEYDLRKALEEVNTLEGIIPICSNCKKIRDDDGYWDQVDSYLSAHTHVHFSHSICPECVSKLYPELDLNEFISSSEQ